MKLLWLLKQPVINRDRIRREVGKLAEVTDALATRLHDIHAPVARNMVPAADYAGVIRPAVSHGGAGSKGCQDCKLIERAWKMLGTDKCERGG